MMKNQFGGRPGSGLVAFVFLSLFNPVVAAELTELVPPGPPRFSNQPPEELASCLKDGENPDGFLVKTSHWESKCPLDELFKKARRIEKKNPALRLIVAEIIYWEIDRLVAETNRQESAKKAADKTAEKIVEKTLEPAADKLAADPNDDDADSNSEGVATAPSADLTVVRDDAPQETVDWTLFHRQRDSGPSTPAEPVVATAATTAAAATPPGPTPTNAQQIDKLLAEAAFWIEPLYADRNAIVSPEAAYKHLRLYAVAKRWEDVRKFIDKYANIYFAKRSTEDRLIQDVSRWYDRSHHAAVSEWLLAKLQKLRSEDVTGQRSSDLFYWLRSLELNEALKPVKANPALLETLRKLSIAYPGKNDQARLNEVVKKLGFEAEFRPVTMREMSFPELMLHAKSQVREVDTLGALRTIRLVRKIDDQLNPDQLWEALEYHVRVLRLLDERPQIPTVLKYYVAKGHFLEAPKKAGDMAKYMSRAHEIAKFYWSYDDPKKADEVLDQLIALNRKNKTDYMMGQFLLMKARIKEQARERTLALSLMDEAIQFRLPEDQKIDLQWRKIFLKLDDVEATKDYKSALTLFEPLKKSSSKDPADIGRWNYWYGRVLLLTDIKDQAKEHFERAYSSDSYSIYSNLAGLELIKLGETPKRWKLIEKNDAVLFEQRHWPTPNWALYFKETGVPTNSQFRDITRVYFLAKAGDYDSAREAFGDLDRSLWQRLFKRNIPWPARREFMRTVAWLRMALKDPMGSLKAAEIARQANGREFENTDLLSLYPLPYWADIQAEATKRKTSPWLVASLIRQESAFNPRARSWANALGLMQMIPPVAKEEAKILKIAKFENEDLYQPSLALMLGTHHLSRLIDRFNGSYICSIASYNAGWPPVSKWLGYYPSAIPLSFIERIPYRETQNYVKSILRNFMNYQRIYKNGEFDLDLITKMPENVAAAALPTEPAPQPEE